MSLLRTDTATYDAEWRPAPEAIVIYSRTFARAVAGVPTFMRYEATSARFQLCYEVDPFIKDPTEIFVSNSLSVVIL